MQLRQPGPHLRTVRQFDALCALRTLPHDSLPLPPCWILPYPGGRRSKRRRAPSPQFFRSAYPDRAIRPFHAIPEHPLYFTDRGIEELENRRGEEEVTIEWLASRLREFVDLNP
ncbi:DUF6104 family protein, partial [Actinacidiphila oryziradicis]|uniref:DUF6104 family protein n=1 Tax=Actinacidiphila oryziradicis TaxID=2571141 RepID=UPI0023F073BF